MTPITFYSPNASIAVQVSEPTTGAFVIEILDQGSVVESHHITPTKEGQMGRLILNLLRIYKVI